MHIVWGRIIALDDWRKKVGTLVGSEYDKRSNQWLHRVYFEYDDELMRNLKSSSLFKVMNHGSTKEEEIFSIMRTVFTEVVNRRIMDLEEKFMEGMAVYPERQTDVAKEVFGEIMKSVNDETFISIMVQQTGLSVSRKKVDKKWVSKKIPFKSSQRPRVGAAVKILDDEELDAIYNQGMEDSGSVRLGKLRGVEIDIKLDVRKMVTTHSGVFGFTGAGKSNMVSNIVRKLVGEASGNANVVVFDIEEEYGALLVDCYVDENKFIVFVDDGSIPKNMRDYMMGESHDAYEASREYVERMIDKMPHELVEHSEDFIPVFERMLVEKRFRVLAEQEVGGMKGFINVILGDFQDVLGLEGDVKSGLVHEMVKWKEGVAKGAKKEVSVETLRRFKKWYQEEYEKKQWEKDGVATDMKRLSTQSDLLIDADFKKIDKWIERREFEEVVGENGYIMSRKEFQDLCQNRGQDSLVVLQGERDEEMFRMVGELITDDLNGIFELRKKKTTWESPITLFVFDEADRFIPQNVGAKEDGKYTKSQEAQRTARSAIQQLVRRGRKIKLGSMIATQRTTYMDTTVLGQIHTYFVNHLPRKVDRDRISEGFGLSEEDLATTSEFAPGEWMILSNNATGLKNRPIMVVAENANKDIEKYIKSYKKKLKI